MLQKGNVQYVFNMQSTQCTSMQVKTYIFLEMMGLFTYVLQEDASEDGAPAQQQGQQADDGHQHIKELPRVVLR